jgi:adenine deaminase
MNVIPLMRHWKNIPRNESYNPRRKRRKNLNALKDLYRMHPDMIMLSSDDIHPEMLKKRHLDKLIAKLINEGYDCSVY